MKAPQPVRRGPVGLGSVCIRAICRAFPIPSPLWPSRGCSAATTTFKRALKGSGTSWLGVSRGIWDPYQSMSGACGGLTEPQRSLLSSFGPEGRSPQPLALTKGSEVPRRRRQPLFKTQQVAWKISRRDGAHLVLHPRSMPKALTHAAEALDYNGVRRKRVMR